MIESETTYLPYWFTAQAQVRFPHPAPPDRDSKCMPLMAIEGTGVSWNPTHPDSACQESRCEAG